MMASWLNKIINRSTSVRKIGAVTGVLSCLTAYGALSAPVMAQDQAVEEKAKEPLGSFIEREMQAKMKELKVAGATVAILKDGKLFYTKGFGVANGDDKKVNAPETLFKWGSISKTFTWTAIMQLVEQGKINLDADINDYLKGIKIPEAFDGPVRVRHLMTHTPGFEDGGLGYVFVRDIEKTLTPREWVKRYPAKRVRPAGEVFAYSNYGSILATLIIEDVSGMTFNRYMEENIFKPLGMTDSTFRDANLPSRFKERMSEDHYARLSKGFAAAKDGFKQVEYYNYMVHASGAGSLVSTATDMAKYAQAHLGGCEYNGSRILQPETCAQMHSPLMPLNAGKMASVNHGFLEHYMVAGQRRVGHNGGTAYFHSEMGLYPDLNFAVLLSVNTSTGYQLNKYMEEAIVKHMFGENKSGPLTIKPAADFKDRAEKYTGYYQGTRRAYSNIEVLYSFFTGSKKVTVDAEGYLLATDHGGTKKLVEVGEDLFRDVETGEYYEFATGKDGKVNYMKWFSSFDKISALEAPENRLLIILASLGVFLTGLITFGIRSLKRYAADENHVMRSARHRINTSTGLWLLSFMILIADLGMLAASGEFPYDFPTMMMRIALTLIILSCLSSLPVILSAVTLWCTGTGGLVIRLYYSFITLMMICLVLVLNAAHMIGFNYH